MTKKTAKIIFFIFNILAIIFVGYVAYDFIRITSDIELKTNLILLDPDIYYFLLMSNFWVLAIVQYVGLKNKQSIIFKYANQGIIAWFLLMILLANVLPNYLTNKLDEAGYSICENPGEIYRVAKGEGSYYIKEGCE